MAFTIVTRVLVADVEFRFDTSAEVKDKKVRYDAQLHSFRKDGEVFSPVAKSLTWEALNAMGLVFTKFKTVALKTGGVAHFYRGTGYLKKADAARIVVPSK